MADRLLLRQIKRYLGEHFETETVFRSAYFQAFLKAIESAYEFNRKELALLERTVELNSRELNEANRRLKEQNEAISKLATTDALTGLPDRLVCQDRIEQALQRSAREGNEFSLLFIDLDRFKAINDTLGHQYGDELLKEVAARLTASVRRTDTVSRLGGDEFTVLLEHITDPGVPAGIARKILLSLSEPYHIMGRELSVTASIGIGVYPRNGGNVVDIFKSADTAMYHVKDNGRNSFSSYDPVMHDRALAQMDIESYLRKALDAGELSLSYHPKLNVATGRLVGTEALLRWHNDRLGDIAPEAFIPVAEGTGLIRPIGAWVVHQACMQNMAWRRKGVRPLHIAVNISGVQTADPAFIEHIDRALADSGMPADLLELEITESTIMRADGIVMENMAKLKARGITLSIDDFGTGYSSLGTLKQFPIDSLKIDDKFVRNVVDDAYDRAIVSAIIAMAKGLKLNVVAEGVETVEQLECLIRSGCELIQGFWVSKPLSAQDMEALLLQDPDYCIGPKSKRRRS